MGLGLRLRLGMGLGLGSVLGSLVTNPKPTPNPNPKPSPSQASYGLIASLAFSALFASTSLLAGAAVDRVDTRALLAGSGVLWGGAMLLQGHAAAFGELLGSRVLLGFSQAFTNPAALCALGRIVPPQVRRT